MKIIKIDEECYLNAEYIEKIWIARNNLVTLKMKSGEMIQLPGIEGQSKDIGLKQLRDIINVIGSL